MPHKSIGFTAELPSNDDRLTSDFMPFFTPNRRPLPNMLEHVEPAGEVALLIYHRMAPFLNLGLIRSSQVRIHPGIYLSSSIDSYAGPTHTYGPTTHSHRGSRMFDIAIHGTVWLFRS
jgi:hypothetical protein